MYNSTVNVTMTATSINSTIPLFAPIQIMEICVRCISFLFSLPTHFYIIWLIITRTGSGVASEFFILNLSVSETGNCLHNLITLLNYWFPSLSTVKQFLTGLAITGRPLFQCLICVERYLAVVHPVTFLKYKPLRYRVICCTAVWIIIISSCLCCMFIIDPNATVYLWSFSVLYLLFLSIQLFCLVAVLRALKQSGPGEKGRKGKEENHMKRRAFYIILITTINMIITYVPFILTTLYLIWSNFVIISTDWLPAVICFLLSGFIHPVLYLCRTVKFPCLSNLEQFILKILLAPFKYM